MANRLRLTTIDGVTLDGSRWSQNGSGPAPGERAGGERAGGERAGGGRAGGGRAGSEPLAIVIAHGFAGSWRRPAMIRVAEVLRRHGEVYAFDFRGHGRSTGRSTVGDREVLDLDAVVRRAREDGRNRVATVGFSMGASIVLRHAALHRGVDAAASVSGPGRWFYRDTWPMRRAHFVVERRLGRAVARTVLRTRISSRRWDPIPMPPTEAATKIAPTPLLVVHGDRDPFFPVGHARDIYEAAREPKELWIETGFGHAEGAADAALIDRIGCWLAAQAPG